MFQSYPYIVIRLLLLTIILMQILPATAQPADQARRTLLENQRNIIHLQKEKLLFQKELQQALDQLKDNENSAELQFTIIDIRDSIEVADILISNISALVSRQRLALASTERGSPPTALDMALNKALNSNLPELAKKLANNESARKEIARLRALLKQQARIGTVVPNTDNSVINAAEQQLAEEEFLRLLSLFSSGTADEAEDKAIKITGTTNNEPFTENDILSYLGHNQYHMETTVYTGRMTFTVDGKPWQLSIAPEENLATYVIIYDITDSEEPRLVMFNKTLLLK
jgi:hypothetical protein